MNSLLRSILVGILALALVLIIIPLVWSMVITIGVVKFLVLAVATIVLYKFIMSRF